MLANEISSVYWGSNNKYEMNIKIAKTKRLYERINLLSQTLNCFKNSRSKKDITNCKYEEQKKIMEIISK